MDDNDLITHCNLIVSTTHNNQAMNEAVRAVAREYFDGREVTEGLLNHIEVAIRAYDPCFSCATHRLDGKLAVKVDIVDPGDTGFLEGEQVDHLELDEANARGPAHRLPPVRQPGAQQLAEWRLLRVTGDAIGKLARLT